MDNGRRGCSRASTAEQDYRNQLIGASELQHFNFFCRGGGMVDPADSKSAVCKDVRVRLSPRAQKDLENRNIFIIFVIESSLILLFYIWRVSDLD